MNDQVSGSMDRMKSDTDAALSVVEMDRNRELAQMSEQERREHMIAEGHEIIGRIQGVNMVAKFADVSSLMWLKDAKNLKIYRDIPGIETWERFCNYLGKSRQHVDEDLANLATFGEEFLAVVSSLRVGYRELRKLRQLSHDGSVTIEANTVRIGDDVIALTPDNAEDLQAAIESLLDAKNREIEDATATIRAKDKVLKAKEQVINKQEKVLATLEGRAKKAGLKPEEEAYIQACDNARISIDGFFAKFDPYINPLPEGHTPRMRAALMETLGYFKRTVDAAFDTAGDLYGDPALDDDWVPPHERETTGPEE